MGGQLAHQRCTKVSPALNLVLKVPLTSDVLLRRRKARSRSSGGREARGRAGGTDRQHYSSQRGCWIQGGRWDNNAPSLQSGVTSEDESCLPPPPTALCASDVTKCWSERNVLPRQWKENEQCQELKRNAGNESEKAPPKPQPNPSSEEKAICTPPSIQKWQQNPSEGCGGTAGGAKHQPQLRGPTRNL